ncbi:MAG TPA: lysophospholipid acyltransferase family protein [Candidatus Acidoferrales bacterium]
MKKFLDGLSYLRSLVVTIPLIYLYTIVMGTISLLVSPFDRRGNLQHACARLWARLIMTTSLVRVRVSGLEHVDTQATYVYCANHQSYLDTTLLFGYLPVKFRIMAKASLFRIPFLGWHLKRAGHMPIARDNVRRAARSLLEAAEHIRAGTPVVVFPEGGRSIPGPLQEFRAGTFLLAIRAGVPAVPVAIVGTRAALAPHSWHIHPARVEMIIHPPIPTEGMRTKDSERLAQQVREVIAATLAARRGRSSH